MTSTLQPPSAPLLSGDTRTMPALDVLLALSRSRASGVLHLEPSGLRFHLREGVLDAVEGACPLGHVLAGLELATTDSFSPSRGAPIGRQLVQGGLVEIYDLWQALEAQARLGLRQLIDLAEETYVFSPHPPLPAPVAGLVIAEALIEALAQKESRR